MVIIQTKQSHLSFKIHGSGVIIMAQHCAMKQGRIINSWLPGAFEPKLASGRILQCILQA